MDRLVEVQRFIVRKTGAGREIHVNVTGCFWCGNSDEVCSACSSRADEAQRAAERAAELEG